MILKKINFCQSAWLSAVILQRILLQDLKQLESTYPYNRNAILCVGYTAQQSDSEENQQTSTDGKGNGKPNMQGM